MFTNAGMNQFRIFFWERSVLVFHGAWLPISQKCLRCRENIMTWIEVGHDCYHHTYV